MVDKTPETRAWQEHLGQVAHKADVTHRAALNGTVAQDYLDWDYFVQVKAPLVHRYVTIGCAVEDAIYASMKTLPGRLRAYSKEMRALQTIQRLLESESPDLEAMRRIVERALLPERDDEPEED